MDKKTVGYVGEALVMKHYTTNGYTPREQNYTIRGGEIDCIVENEKYIVFVEVKVVNHIDDLQSFITGKKLYYVQKTIEQYLHTHAIDKDPRLDVVFVKQGQIIEVFENITLG